MRARKPKGSVVFNRLRGTWNLLYVQDGRRRSRKLGTLSEIPTRTDALRKAEAVRRGLRLLAERAVPTVAQLVEQYRVEKMPQCYSTRRGYECWLRKHIVPRWGQEPITVLAARPVELWLHSLKLTPKSKAHIKGLLHILWDYAMWAEVVPTARNPMELIRIQGVTKRVRIPKSLTVEEFRRFIVELEEPYQTIALVCVLRAEDQRMSGSEVGGCGLASWQAEH